MEDSHSTLSPSSLLCQETDTSLEEEVDEDTFINIKDYSLSNTEEEEEYIEMLVERETSMITSYDCSLMIAKWIKCARLEAITWILKTRAVFGFRFQTAYLSVTYLDRFLSRRAIDSEKVWAIRLLSVACLSLAAKMEECRVPGLSEFEVEEYNFDSKVIQRMELMVLNTLEWRMGSITPFAFIHYFITKFCKDSPPRHIVSRTVELILAIMREINLMDRRPSIIAAAATLVVLDQKLTRNTLELKINAISSCGCLEIEDLFSCYSLMHELETEILKLPKFIISPDLSPIKLRQTDGFENSSITSATISTKRKRLRFNDCDPNYGVPDEKRLR